jgi:hypothetical protein
MIVLLLGLVPLVGPGCSRKDVYAVARGDAGDDGSVLGTELYVSPTGDDANPGTLALPFRTIAKARDVVRTLNQTMTADITVFLRGGTYAQTSTLRFSNGDSGSGGFNVKYVAYPGERPLLSGGRPISGWKLFDANKALYAASAGDTDFRQLYVNGVKAIRARSPNLGANGAPNFNRITGYSTSAHTIQVSSGDVGTWSNPTKVEMHTMMLWSGNILRIASMTTAGGSATLKFQEAEDAILFVRPFPYFTSKQCYTFENAIEFLDQPGEWYLDESARVVYYKPRAGEDMTNAMVVAPMIETIMSITGTSSAEPTSHLWFVGVSFAHSTFMRPSHHGLLDAQAGQYNLTATADNKQTLGRPPAGVTVTNAHHIRFERNMFAQMAATGLDFVSGTHDDVIVGNVFTQIGGSGLSVGKFTADEATDDHVPYNPVDKNEICTDETIQNNYVNDVTTEIQGACGIAAGYPRRIVIEHNEVTGTNYSGISVGYGWTTAPNAMSNNRINHNNVHHVANILGAGGGIATLSNQGPGSEIQYNHLHDFRQSPCADLAIAGIQLNEGTSGYTVAHNLMVDVPGVVYGPNTGTNSVTDNGQNILDAESILDTAGIEPSYADIKTLAVPAATF